MAYVQLVAYHVPVLDVHQFWKNPWISGIPSKKQARYPPVANCTYWPVLGSYKNWYIIDMSPKSTPFEAFDDIPKVVLDGISENMASSVQSGTKNGLYVIQFISEAYTLQNNTTIDGHIVYAG